MCKYFEMWVTKCALVFLACAVVVFGRRSPNAADIEEYYLRGPEAGRYSNDLIEDALLDVPDLVRKYGYSLEVHNVRTEDGYLLELHRIPQGRDQNNFPDHTRPAVLVQHGLTSSSADFVLMGPGIGLGYILAEAGFDVWLGNARGNYYSRKHSTLDPDAREDRGEFWRFSWEEIGSKDLPAMIDHILAVTGKPRLHYIGHSQGTTVFFVMGALRPEYNEKIISMHALAPVAYMEHNINRLFLALAPYANSLELLGRLIGVYEVLPNSPFFTEMGQNYCADGTTTQILCSNFMFLFAGGGAEFHNATMLPVKLGHTPAGISLRQIAHYGQHISKDFFRRYDHGLLTNFRLYGSFTPPSFDLSKVTSPVFLHYAEVDTFAHPDDVERLWRELGRPMGKIRVAHRAFGHVDFMWGTEAKTLVYDRVIDIMKSFGNL